MLVDEINDSNINMAERHRFRAALEIAPAKRQKKEEDTILFMLRETEFFKKRKEILCYEDE